MKNKKAFSFVELLVVVSIVILLGVVIFNFNNNYRQNTINSTVKHDLTTIKNSLLSYLQDKNILPNPEGNLNFFTNTGVYTHDDFENGEASGTGTYGFYGKITEKTLPKSYLNFPTIDPRTGEYYSYGILRNREEFEVAGVVTKKDDNNSFEAVVNGNYKAEKGLYNLIREYNGNEFVEDKKSYLPYNPYERKLVVTDDENNVYEVGEEIKSGSSYKYLYFSDGSVTRLEPNTTLVLSELDFPKENKLISKIKLNLQGGAIWTKATKLMGNGETEDDSIFEVSAGDTTAAVRGTIFKMNSSGNVSVLAGKVKITRGGNSQIKTNYGENIKGLQAEISNWKNYSIPKDRLDLIKQVKQKEEKLEKQKAKQALENDPNNYCYFDGEKFLSGSTFTGYYWKAEDGDKGCDYKNLECRKGVIYNFGGEKLERSIEDYKKYRHLECCFYLDEDNGCVKSDLEGYKLVAYAPYDESGDLGMYYASGSLSPVEKANITNVACNNCGGGECSSSGCNFKQEGVIYEKDNSFAKFLDGTRGIFIDNNGDGDKLKYNIRSLNLGDNFAIEMRVRGKALKPSDNKEYFLYDSDDIYLKIRNGKLFMGYYKTTTTTRTIKHINDLNSLYDNTFYSIIAIYNGNNWNLKINGLKTTETPNIPVSTNISNLYIGSSKNTDKKQINDIIDYVKLYKKNPSN